MHQGVNSSGDALGSRLLPVHSPAQARTHLIDPFGLLARRSLPNSSRIARSSRRNGPRSGFPPDGLLTLCYSLVLAANVSPTAMFCSSSVGRHDESCDQFGMQREIRIFMPIPFYWRRYFCSGTRCETCRADHTFYMFRETRAAVGIWHEYPQERS